VSWCQSIRSNLPGPDSPMPDIPDDLAEARAKLDAARVAIERHPEVKELVAKLERMAAEVARIEGVAAKQAVAVAQSSD
jgi:alkylation response protein AidB-like acyl-CoA dehydrogenase